MNVLTFDIEDWFHILDNDSTQNESQWDTFESRIHKNTGKILNCLEKYGTKATFFCLGWVAHKYPDLIKTIDSSGYDIASHSYSHQLVYQMNREEFIEDLKRSIDSIQQITGKKIRAYRAPGFSITENNTYHLEALISCGIEVDCSIFPTQRAHGGFPSYKPPLPSYIDIDGLRIKEFPLNTFTLSGLKIIFSGGGYFRLLPYWLISFFMDRSPYTISYFHPRDFDPEQPVLPDLSLLRNFKSYIGLRRSYAKLENLLRDYEFVDLETATRNLNWSSVQTIYL